MSKRNEGDKDKDFEKLEEFFNKNKKQIEKTIDQAKEDKDEEPGGNMSWPPDDLAARRNLKND
jgi:hypothetical protein